MQNKRGQGLSVNAIVLIVLAVVVLVVLILGFYFGWDSLGGYIKKNNLASLQQGCELACSTQSVYDYCEYKRELRIDQPMMGLEDKGKYTCKELAENLKTGIKKCLDMHCITQEDIDKAKAEEICGKTTPISEAFKINIAGEDCHKNTDKNEKVTPGEETLPTNYVCCYKKG